MKRRGHLQHHGAPRALGLGDLDRALDRRLVAGHHDLPATIAGCAFSVSVSFSAGPSHMVAVSFSPSAASTSSNTARAGAKASASALPMPTAWLPCPGNTKAAVMPDPCPILSRNRAGKA